MDPELGMFPHWVHQAHHLVRISLRGPHIITAWMGCARSNDFCLLCTSQVDLLPCQSLVLSFFPAVRQPAFHHDDHLLNQLLSQFLICPLLASHRIAPLTSDGLSITTPDTTPLQHTHTHTHTHTHKHTVIFVPANQTCFCTHILNCEKPID